MIPAAVCPQRTVFISAYDRRYLEEIAQLEREAQARGDIADAIRWGKMYEQLEAELFEGVGG